MTVSKKMVSIGPNGDVASLDRDSRDLIKIVKQNGGEMEEDDLVMLFDELQRMRHHAAILELWTNGKVALCVVDGEPGLRMLDGGK